MKDIYIDSSTSILIKILFLSAIAGVILFFNYLAYINYVKNTLFGYLIGLHIVTLVIFFALSLAIDGVIATLNSWVVLAFMVIVLTFFAYSLFLNYIFNATNATKIKINNLRIKNLEKDKVKNKKSIEKLTEKNNKLFKKNITGTIKSKKNITLNSLICFLGGLSILVCFVIGYGYYLSSSNTTMKVIEHQLEYKASYDKDAIEVYAIVYGKGDKFVVAPAYEEGNKLIISKGHQIEIEKYNLIVSKKRYNKISVEVYSEFEIKG